MLMTWLLLFTAFSPVPTQIDPFLTACNDNKWKVHLMLISFCLFCALWTDALLNWVDCFINANIFVLSWSVGDIFGDVCSVFRWISCILLARLPEGSSWWWRALRWRVNKAVSDLRGVEPAVLLSVRLDGKPAGGGINLSATSGTSTLDVSGIVIRRANAAYRRLGSVISESLLMNNPDKWAHYYQLIQHKCACHLICRSTDGLRRGLKLPMQEAD